MDGLRLLPPWTGADVLPATNFGVNSTAKAGQMEKRHRDGYGESECRRHNVSDRGRGDTDGDGFVSGT